MNEIVIEHVEVNELPEPWRRKLAAAGHARVTVRIEHEPDGRGEQALAEDADDPLFGMWRDRAEVADVEAYLRALRAPRC